MREYTDIYARLSNKNINSHVALYKITATICNAFAVAPSFPRSEHFCLALESHHFQKRIKIYRRTADFLSLAALPEFGLTVNCSVNPV